MKRLVGTLKRKSTQIQWPPNGASYPQDTPEDIVIREIVAKTAFCDSGTIGGPQGDEYLHLPAIVEAAESSPSAARVAAGHLHKYLLKPNSSKPQRQYNAIMLVRILADNPGPTFTRNIDSRFVSSLKILLRDGQEVSVQQILRETLEFLSTNKAHDTNLAEVNTMWKKEKDKFVKQFGVHPLQQPAQGTYAGYRQDFFSSEHRIRKLPTPEELAGRVAEAGTSAKLLQQMVQSTPPSEFFDNDMLKEFASRCQRASRSLQAYMEATNPAPDEETMMTLIETNDKISSALSKYQRAQLNARKHTSTAPPQAPTESPFSSAADATAIPTSQSQVPNLSIPRKAVDQAPGQQQTATRSTGIMSGDVSPIDSTAAPPLVPPRPQANTASRGFQYQPGEFQVENPFADKYSTIDERAQNPGNTTAGAPPPVTNKSYPTKAT
ncbi:hypothetical protein LOZ39_006513 [Ophidiomyces ophidiicola]|nr:hypothetical protein LOZ46_006398 [Ophidiomyces ophidiicola]KAI2030379.1 hypothetical protein LOZ47_006498 [Ophidiomyces ophidiicola]KAI2066151.1 hypothetical protein LOZ39_006513 [Ophidiomyces ophidiicola]KAI2089050.1 hypothetical protein LOZ35_005643 [Ophidiomyces ophidiicola]KAI2117800.1 hypothetical protein LOZ31_006236 [Ophidiomyces ophidiicola]